MLFILTIFQIQSAFSQLLTGDRLVETHLSALVTQVQNGTVILLGENHGNATHRDQHLAVLRALRAAGLRVSVGMEFIDYTKQEALDLYRQRQIDEATFLKEIKWGGVSFDYYRLQVLFPELSQGENTIGLNIPRAITNKISRQGLNSLTTEEVALMPPNFSLGRNSYRERFMLAAGGHCQNPQNCFIAQCTWDDTMAWQALKFIEQNPEQVLVVIVGEFHVQYGGGIKYRIQQRNPKAKVLTLSQIWAHGMTDNDLKLALRPSLTEGPRADYLWISGHLPK